MLEKVIKYINKSVQERIEVDQMTQAKQMKARKGSKPSPADYALSMTAYHDEQERLKYLLEKVFEKYGKPKMSLKELRKKLQVELGDISLSQEIIKMREEGL